MKKLILIMSIACLFSCVEDEGNYTYSEVNQVIIEGIEESYNVLNGFDRIQIQPKITSTILGENLDNYEYQWHIHEGLGEHIHTVIGNEKDLDYLVNIGVGTYTLYLTVLDKTTEIKTMASASLKVSTPASKGFLLLGDDMEEGIVGLDMVAMPAGRDTSVVENVYDNSETHFVGADRIFWSGPRGGLYFHWEKLWMCTENGSYRMNHAEDITIYSELNDMGMIELSKDYEKKTPMRVLDVFPRPTQSNRSSSYGGYLTEDVAVQAMTISSEFFTKPFNRVNANTYKLFKFYPLAFTNGASYSGHNCVLLYNKDEERFMKMNKSYGATHCTALNDYASDKFPWNQQPYGRTIVWGGLSVKGTNGNTFAIMKDQEGNHYLYEFTLSYSPTKVNSYDIDLSVAENFANASHYMVSGTNSQLLYAYGSTLYLYDYAYKKLLKRPMDAEITYLDYEYSSKGSKTQFIVATYSDAEKGIVRKLEVGTDVNNLEIIDRPKEVWNTRLRVKDVEYIWH